MMVLAIVFMSSITITTGSTTCKDNKSRCKEWADKGYCHGIRYTEYMERECRLTCGICSPVTTTSAQRTAVSSRINGNWGCWSEYSSCNKTCGRGYQSRSRPCDNPAPAHGGKDCSGKGEMTTDCNIWPCPVNGTWGEWSKYGACSNTCGGGHKKRSRSCDNPAPAHGGKDCPGKGDMSTDCNTQPCPVNGNWGCWSEYSSCNKTCGRGHQSRSRSCDNPAPAHGGKDCFGKGEMTKDCSIWPCPVNGTWGEWSKYGACSNTCDGGQKKRSRSCDNPAPANGGKDCPGKGEMSTDCNTQPCPVNGNWGCWSEYRSCSKTCGRGHQNRSRSCDNPAPAHGGKDCFGKEEMTTDCNIWPCPDINECTTITAPCNSHGQCRNTDGSFTCDCQCGYTGDRCGTDINQCKPQNPCKNNGVCICTPGSFYCDCSGTGFRGPKCDTGDTWLITTLTSDVEFAETTNNVRLNINGGKGVSRNLIIGQLDRDTTREFRFEKVYDVGNVQTLRVELLGNDGWHFESITIKNIDRQRQYLFNYNNWIDADSSYPRIVTLDVVP